MGALATSSGQGPRRPGGGPGEGHRPSRRWKAWARFGLGFLLLATLVGLVVRTPAGAAQLASAFKHFRVSQLPWLFLSVALEAGSVGAAALAQQKLLRSGGASVGAGSLFGVTLAANAVAYLVPAGAAPASGWLVSQYRSRGASRALSVWVVLASGIAIAISLMGLFLVGAAIAGIWGPVGLLAAAAALIGGSVGLVVGARRLAKSRWLRSHLRGHLGRDLGDLIATVASYRASVPSRATVLGLATLNWLLNAGPLVAGFVMLGLPVPWRALLFAYAASQVASGLSFLPSGLGPLQGGMVGGFVLAGASPAPALAASLLYSVVAYWGLAGAGTVALAVQARHSPRRRLAGSREASALPASEGATVRGREAPAVAGELGEAGPSATAKNLAHAATARAKEATTLTGHLPLRARTALAAPSCPLYSGRRELRREQARLRYPLTPAWADRPRRRGPAIAPHAPTPAWADPHHHRAPADVRCLAGAPCPAEN